MGAGFLGDAEQTPQAQALYAEDLADLGFVMNASRLWAHHPAAVEGLFDLLDTVNREVRLSVRERGILVAACSSTMGDSYCSLAWGGKLSTASDPELAAAVLRGTDEGLTPAERAMATWARAVASDPGGTTTADVGELRRAGFDDARIFAMTAWVALRIAFSTVNDALGAVPDAELVASLPPEVRDAVTWGRPPESPSGRDVSG